MSNEGVITHTHTNGWSFSALEEEEEEEEEESTRSGYINHEPGNNAMGNAQYMGKEQWAINGQRATGNAKGKLVILIEQLNNEQWTMDNEQWTMNNEQWTMNNEQWTMNN